MRVMGIDPGIAILGYGVLDVNVNKYRLIDSGAITTSSELSMPQRLSYIYKNLTELIEFHKPNSFAVEELFFNKNTKTALTVGHARGVIILAASNLNVPIYEYTPLQVKQAIVGYGRADKRQMQQMVKILLNLRDTPKPDDVADALAVAICHGSSAKYSDLFKL